MLTYVFDRKSHTPLYEQLYTFIRDDIISGVIEGDGKLPSKRELASHLGISKITVETAYSNLISEGYVYSLEKKGYYAEKHLSIPQRHISDLKLYNESENKFEIDLSSNTVPTGKFPFSVWSKLMREMILNYSRELLDPLPYNGALALRKAICKYLYEERGMNVSPAQIIVGAGSEYLYSQIIRLLGTEVIYGIENPSYHKIRRVYQMNSASYQLINQDDMNKKINDSLDVLHISPSHNFPTGRVMGAKLRHELISWANEKDGRYIIEDDFDSELRFSGKPLPPMQTLDSEGKVIYVNTFSKTISPSFRIGYMVLPHKLAEKYGNNLGFNSNTVPAFEQYTLAAFIERGYYERHISRMKKYYRIHRAEIMDMFKNCKMSSISEIEEAEAGLHFMIRLKTDYPDSYIKSELAKRKVKVIFMSDYSSDNYIHDEHLMLVNYSGLEKEDFGKVLNYLYEICS